MPMGCLIEKLSNLDLNLHFEGKPIVVANLKVQINDDSSFSTDQGHGYLGEGGKALHQEDHLTAWSCSIYCVR